MAIELYGYRYSVYSWIARLALHEKGKAYDWIEVNPFAENIPASYLATHPFKRVPALVHTGFVVYETGAITRYVDEAFEGPKLQPAEPRERARCNQIMSIADSYAYWPLVRQVFSHGVFRPLTKVQADANEFQKGLEAAPRVLSALEKAAGEGQYLCGNQPSLADIHLAPMIGYFVLAPEGKTLLHKHRRLSDWWAGFSKRSAFVDTTPQLPSALP
ncbi:glutathione S-transferase family protein [Bradyrhizobium sp. 186]|uniref:glutathione S-transferase family protein n=1 Tax=Bradyrhizobium sp. 186 TaxID=2782654 RepID=UPI0020018526|nr:glutathione S-transferase family protein [Bradyrhizobium sp. 186]UPK40004.1 glutathione S-transferase family protein [Bradyrhizobium sp. 186]